MSNGNINIVWIPISIVLFLIFILLLLFILYKILKYKAIQYLKNQALADMHKICESTYPVNKINNSGTSWDTANAFSFYQLCLQISSWSECNTSLQIQDFTINKTVQSTDPASKKTINIACIYYNSKINMVIIVFAGTVFLSEWTDDFDYKQKQPSFVNDTSIQAQNSQCIFYENMRNQILSTLDTLPKTTTIIVTGHSLGGALASFCFLDLITNRKQLQSVLYTYAMPRAGNISFANLITNTDRSFRVCNTEDIIPYFPLPVMPGNYIYEHFGKLVSFTLNTGNIVDNHMTSYSKFLSSQK